MAQHRRTRPPRLHPRWQGYRQRRSRAWRRPPAAVTDWATCRTQCRPHFWPAWSSSALTGRLVPTCAAYRHGGRRGRGAEAGGPAPRRLPPV